MKPKPVLLAALACFLSALAVGAEEPQAKVAVATPDFVAAGESFTIPIGYELRAGLTARLNVELKNARHIVLLAARKEVSGKGVFEAKLRAPAEPQQIMVAAWVGTDWRKSLSPIRHTLPFDVVSPALAATRRGKMKAHHEAAEKFLESIGPRPADRYAIALLKDDLPGHDPKLADELADLLRKRGHELTLINADLLVNRFAISAHRFDMLFLPACHTLPGEAGPVIKHYIAKGGDIAALGTPAFRTILTKVGGRWVSKQGLLKLLAEQPTKHVVLDFESEDLSRWTRHTNTPKAPLTRELAPGRKGRALRVDIPNLRGWDGLASPTLESPFPKGHSLTCFWIRGVGPTRKLSFEWRERDGSRWIAVFPVTGKWRRVVLPPGDFKFWQSVKTRGHAGDRFRPENAVQLVLGAAFTHTGPRPGKYEFLIDEIGTAPAPGNLTAPEFLNPPVIENLSPSYKFYRVAHATEVSPDLFFVDADDTFPVPGTIMAHHPRPIGAGYRKGRSWRWIPLLGAETTEDFTQITWRGALASMYVDFSTSSVRLAIGGDDPGWYRRPRVRTFLLNSVQRMATGLFLREAGAEFYTYRPGREITLGARVANVSRRESGKLVLRFLFSPDVPDGPLFSSIDTFPEAPFAVASGNSVEFHYARAYPPPDSCENELVARLHKGTNVIDEVYHALAVLHLKPEAERLFVTVRDGDFWLDGKKWYPHGVNYMPSTGIGIEDGDYFEHWIGARAYDPEFIQRDLERIKDIGFNSVSIFIYHKSVAANNLLDFLRRCERLGLYVNLSIRPGTPMDYRWEWWKEIIEKNRLWEQDIIWAYDIAWEPFFGSEVERRRYDPQWRKWLAKRHGSLDAAEKAWSFTAPRHDGKLSCPTGKQLTRDDKHRKMVADYRNFADELIHERYLAAYKKIKAIDPNHLVSFRMTVTGDPTFNSVRRMPYDFRGVARAMDFMAPEGYGRIGDWERVKPGMFTVAYARHCAPAKPVFWAEAGVSVWDRDSMRADPERLAFQGRYFADVYKMALGSHSNGIAWWWYPGGFRVGENSDYGIINPDGTDRPCTKVIRQFARRMTAPRTIPKPNHWIDIDRDADARGLFGIYEKVKKEYWQAIQQGKTPGLRQR